jgi:excisionase family DNA binding protein
MISAELDGSRCFSLSEAAEYLRVCPRTIRREIDRGRLAAFRVGRNLRITLAELRRYTRKELVAV